MLHDRHLAGQIAQRPVLAYRAPNPTDRPRFPIRSLLLFIVSSGVAGLACLWALICLSPPPVNPRRMEEFVFGSVLWMMACAGAGIIALITLLVLWQQKRGAERSGLTAITAGAIYAASTWVAPIAGTILETIRSERTGKGDFVLDSVALTITFAAFLFGPLLASYVMMGASKRQP